MPLVAPGVSNSVVVSRSEESPQGVRVGSVGHEGRGRPSADKHVHLHRRELRRRRILDRRGLGTARPYLDRACDQGGSPVTAALVIFARADRSISGALRYRASKGR